MWPSGGAFATASLPIDERLRDEVDRAARVTVVDAEPTPRCGFASRPP
jgi:hypothetical protein